MANEKHKGTEFSNISRVWEQNEKREPHATEIHDKGNAFSNVSDAWAENEKREGLADEVAKSTGEEEAETP